ncbi:MAG: type II and III secretion system protein [Fimbriimonadaceae bacterium]|nr:type II and III secretion system protein [Fimbriimonadaceae bacterium]
MFASPGFGQESVAVWRGAKAGLGSGGATKTPATPPTNPAGPATPGNQTNTSQPGGNQSVDPGQQILAPNTFEDMSIPTIAAQLSLVSNVTVIADTSISSEQTISFAHAEETLEGVLKKLALAAGGAEVIRIDARTFLITLLKKDSPLFFQYAESQVYRTKNEKAENVFPLLSKQVQDFVTVRNETSTLMVTAPKALLTVIMKQIEMIDRPARQIVVEAMITELEVVNGSETGFSWSWKNFAVDNGLIAQYSKATFEDVAKLKALIIANKARLRAQPRLAAFEGRMSEFFVGQETYFSILSGNVNFPTAQIQKIDSGVKLKFTALVGDDGWITLDLQPEVSDAVANNAGNPTTTIRRANTQVRVRSGETIAIGGMMQDSDKRRVTKLPILGDIPLIGELFRQTTTEKKTTEVIMLITPHVGQGLSLKK